MKWGSRKVWVAISFTCLFSAMTWEGTLPPDTLEFLVMITLGGYFGANVGEHFATRGKP